MSEAYQLYERLCHQLTHMRRLHRGEEDAILDKMDSLWWIMTDTERERAEKLPDWAAVYPADRT